MLRDLAKRLDERVPLKHLYKRWGGRAQFLVRLVTLATFIDDVVRVTVHWGEHVDSVSNGYLSQLFGEGWYALTTALPVALLALGLVTQGVSTALILANVHADVGTCCLLAWCMLHPALYAQLSNFEFCAETITLMGGLFILLSQVRYEAKDWRPGDTPAADDDVESGRAEDGDAKPSRAGDQLIGRLLLPVLYVYHVCQVVASNLSDLTHASKHTYFMYVVDVGVVGVLVAAIGLIVIGLRSRACALAMALLNLLWCSYEHPWWLYVGAKSMAELPPMADQPYVEDVDTSRLEPWHIVDMHRYFFFQGVSTTGALLLLAVHGPGEVAVEEAEQLLPDAQVAKD